MTSGLVRRALLEHARRSHRRFANADFSDISFDPLFRGVNDQIGPTGGRPTTTNEITVQGLVDAFLGDPAKANLRPKSRLDYEVMFRMLVDIVGGDKPARALDREDARAVRDLLIRFPKHATKRLPGVTPETAVEVAKQRGMPTLSPASVNAYMGAFSALLRYANREGWISSNVAEGLQVAEDQHPRDARDAFTGDQLAHIFGDDLYREPRATWNHRQWVPLLALYSGARLGEICQLRCADVEKVDDVDAFLIRAGPGQRLKNTSARRLVPVHAAIRSAFLDHVERQRARGEHRLFPNSTSRSVGQWFGSHLRRVNSKVTGGGLHQFRHLMADSLAEASVPGDLIDELMGWARVGMRNRYGSGIRASVLYAEIAKVKYEIDLDHLGQV